MYCKLYKYIPVLSDWASPDITLLSKYSRIMKTKKLKKEREI